MALKDLTAEDVTTRWGRVRLSTTNQGREANRPVVFAIPGVLSANEPLVNMGEGLGLLADFCLMQLPSFAGAAVSSCAIPDLSALVAEVIETRFAGRQVVLLGVSTGAVIALGVRASNLARVVAVEPPLVTEGLWPLVEPLRELLRSSRDATTATFVLEAFGVSETGLVARDYRSVLDGLAAPVDVIVGDAPLNPQRELERFPSLVDEAERWRLAATPGVRMHLARDAGHNVVGHAVRTVYDVLREACRRAAARLSAERLRLDEPLLEATPLTARRVLHWGADGAVFARAVQAANPLSEIVILGDDADADLPPEAGGGFEAVVLAGPAPPALLGRLAAALQPGGHLIARWAAAPDVLRHELAPHGLVPREAVDDGGTGVVRAQKTPKGEAPRPAMHVLAVPYASLLMDIRTRLPATGLGSDPELQVAYVTPPLALPTFGYDLPKVLVVQRPAELRLEAWRGLLADAIAKGWLLVIEYDDYPPLVAEVLGQPVEPDAMLRFSYVHAVQTASPPLVEAFRPYNPETVLFPNAVFDLRPYPQQPRLRRVFYGGVLRGRYAVEVASSLGPAIQRCPDTEFVVIGDREFFDALPTRAKEFHGYLNYEAYLDLMSGCAISLSPIEALPHRDTKSDAKFLDASSAGLLTIASPTIYDRVIEHGVNGFLAPQVADWAPLLEQALTDEPLRDRMARNAWDYVRRERMFANQVALRRDWYRDLWARRRDLNEAVMDRVPGLRAMLAGPDGS